MAEPRFFVCPKCGNFVELYQKGTCPIMCCGAEMKELKGNTTDGAAEKHVPDVTVSGDTVTVKVGSVEHPMADDHWIQWIYVQTEKGSQRKVLNPGEKPCATFTLNGDKAVAVYEYCNKHGLWKAVL